MSKKCIAILIMSFIFIGVDFASTGTGKILEYEIITSSQLIKANTTDKITRNEEAVLLNLLTRKCEVVTKEVEYKDITKLSNFWGILNRLSGLNLSFEKDSKGMFLPNKNVVIDEMAIQMLTLLNYKVPQADAYEKANAIGLLKELEKNEKGKEITTKNAYQIIENALNMNINETNIKLEQQLKFTKSNNEVTNSNVAEKLTLTNSVIKVARSSKNTVIVQFKEAITEKSISALEIYDSLNNAVKVTSYGRLVDDLYLIRTNNLDEGKAYFFKLNNVVESKVKSNSESPLYVIGENLKVNNSREINVEFNVPVDPEVGFNISNYSISKGLIIKSINYYKNEDGFYDFNKIQMETSEQIPGTIYELSLSESIKNNYASTASLSKLYRTVTFVGSSTDIYAPKLNSVSDISVNSIRINFIESSGLNRNIAIDPLNYKIYEINTQKEIKISKADLKRNKNTQIYSDVVLEVQPLEIGKVYMVEVLNAKDIYDNKISSVTEFRSSFSFGSITEKPARIISIEAISNTLVKVIFDKDVFIPDSFTLGDISISNDVKVIGVKKDSKSQNILWVETSSHESAKLTYLKMQNVYDKFGNESHYSEASQYYSPVMGSLSKIQIGLIENQIIKDRNIVAVTFSKEITDETLLNVNNYSIEGLKILYVYKVNSRQIKIATEQQKRGQIYFLQVNNLQDNIGSRLEENRIKSFVGMTLEN